MAVPIGTKLLDDNDLALVTLGGFALVDSTSHQRLGPGKPLALLAYLACSPSRTASRDQLVDLLWADADPGRARHALRQALWQLRQHLGEHGLTGKDEVRLEARLTTDRNRFLEQIEQGDLEAAIATYQGPFLTVFASPGGAAFEHWADAERRHLGSTFMHAADLHARRLLAAGRGREAIDVARRMMEVEPFAQSGGRLLIEAHLACGDIISASAAAAAFERWASEEETELDPASLAMIARSRSDTNERSGVDLNAATSTSGRLVADLVGREAEFATILVAWSAARQGPPAHLHIVAPAGLGKTRLLLDLEARLRSTGARVCYVRANPGDREIPGALASAIARSLGALPGAMAVAPAVAATLVGLDPSLANLYRNAEADQSHGDEARRRRVLALVELVQSISDESALALLIDDLHWADDDSLVMLEALIARLGKARILLVSATRPRGNRQLRSELRHTITLKPLSQQHIAALLESLAEFSSDELATALAGQLHTASDGNPLLVLELLQLASERELLRIVGTAWRLARPIYAGSIFESGDGIRQRIEQLGPHARELLTILAVAGSPLDEAVLELAASLDQSGVAAQLALLDRQGFAHRAVNGWQPTHDEIAAVASDLPAHELESVHRRLATALEQTAGASATTLARSAQHFAAIGDHDSITRLVVRCMKEGRDRHGPRSVDQTLSQLLGPSGAREARTAIRHRLPFRLRHRLAPIGIAAAVVVAAIALLGWRHHEKSVELAAIAARSIIFEAIWQEDTTLTTKAAMLRVDPVEWNPTDPPRFGPPHDLKQRWVNWRMPARFDASGHRLLASSVIDSDFTASQDIMLIDTGTTRVLAKYPRDDVDPTFTVDGRGILFVTTRWAPQELDDYDIGYMAFGDMTVRPIVNDRDGEVSARQSPDGTRIAYVRKSTTAVANAICITIMNGGEGSCQVIGDYSEVGLDDWLDDSHLLIYGTRAGRVLLMNLDPATHVVRQLLDYDVSRAVLDAGREFLLCICINPASERYQLYLYSLKEERGSWIASPSSFPVTQIIAVKPRKQNRYLDSLVILRNGALVPNKRYQLRSRGYDQDRQPVAFDTTTRRWRVLGGPAEIDSMTGIVVATDTGLTTIELSAGGWRSDTAALKITSPESLLRFEEDWIGPLTDKPWRGFESPRPRLAVVSGLGPALLPNGDRQSASGVYSTESWNPVGGLTLEWTMSTPLTLPVHQNITIEFRSANDSLFLADWDHKSGWVPGFLNSRLGQCGMRYPSGEGIPSRKTITLVDPVRSSAPPAPADQASGAIHSWRLTIFADGTCGLAVDSMALVRSRAAISFRWPLRLWISGQSERTTIAVGKLRIWQGDPGGVDWEALDREE